MSDAPRDDTWWQASDGKWYPPRDHAPFPGWWLASDGNWYPPEAAPTESAAPSEDRAAEAPNEVGPAPAKSGSATGRAAGKAAGRGRNRDRTKPQPLKTPKPETKPQPPAESDAGSVAPRPSPTEPSTAGRATSGAKPLPGPRPNANEGLSPQEQIARRNQASQADRDVLARSRALAASRLLANVAKDIGAETGPRSSTRSAADVAPAPTPTTKPTSPSTPTSPPAKPAAAKAAKSAKSAKSGNATPEVAAETSAPTPSAPSPSPSGGGSSSELLLEVKPSALATDLDHLGERLAIFSDRVELRDRHNGVRQVVLGADIADIVVHKRLTGAVLTIETVEGPVMVAKGLRPEQAEEARQLIMRRTRPTGPVQRTDRPAPSTTLPTSPPVVGQDPRPDHIDVVEQTPVTDVSETGARPGSPVPTRPIDEADVLRKLGDLHRLGILTADEYQDKIALVGSLVRGEITLPA